MQIFMRYSLDCKIVKHKSLKLEGWLIKSDSGGEMILCFHCEDLSQIFLLSKFEMNWPHIKLIITFCAPQVLILRSPNSRNIFDLLRVTGQEKVSEFYLLKLAENGKDLLS